MSPALLDRSRVEIKLADYGVAPATALADSLLLMKVQDYRRSAASRLYPYSALRCKKSCSSGCVAVGQAARD